MMNNVFSYLPNGAAKYEDKTHENAWFILQKQLKDREIWGKFVKVFHDKSDGEDNGWRGEYFGKMMRGACLTYRYCPDQELYEILYDTVHALLALQDGDGRITAYEKAREYNGWDVWTRKYVLVGCLYFYSICKDETFKESIIGALKKHVDYMIATLGDGKLSILDSTECWGGLSSCSILEPIIELYKVTQERAYLSFAEYILSTGGCKGGNLAELAERDELYPYQYPEVKAYEMMSYFEGILAYYEITGNPKYLEIVQKFVDAVQKSDVTVIGCSGCTHELFDNSAVKQTEGKQDGGVMQETCVTVTWMRLLERLLRLTGKAKYADWIERSAYNALYGSINTYGNKQYSIGDKEYVEGLPFDSYSPLVYQARGLGIGGFKRFVEGGYYGCCACIGAAGTGLFPLMAVMQNANGYVFTYYHEGVVKTEETTFYLSGNYMTTGEVKIKICLSKPAEFQISLRIPEWGNASSVSVCGEERAVDAGYYCVKREWRDGDVIVLRFHPEVKKLDLNGKSAFLYGNIVLARDEQKETGDIQAAVVPLLEKDKLIVDKLPPERDEMIRVLLKTKDGNVLLTDYASCGKKWLEERNRISVWF